WPSEQLELTVIEQNIQGDLLEYDRQLLHSHVGAYLASTEYGIMDEDILNAIRYHTSGRPHMSLLEKIVCLADYMEPGRQFPDVEQIRNLAEVDLNKALVLGLDSTIKHLISTGKLIYPLTIGARNHLIM